MPEAGHYRNPGVRQSRSARFGNKRTEQQALDIVLKWMWAKHEEAIARNEWLAKIISFKLLSGGHEFQFPALQKPIPAYQSSKASLFAEAQH